MDESLGDRREVGTIQQPHNHEYEPVESGANFTSIMERGVSLEKKDRILRSCVVLEQCCILRKALKFESTIWLF